MYILINDGKYGKAGRTISNYEYNRIPLNDQLLFKKFNFQDPLPKPATTELSQKLPL